MTALDAIVVAVMTIALVRGLWIGMVRELFSLGAIVAACIAVRLFAGDGGEWLLGQPAPRDDVTVDRGAGSTV